MNRVYYLSEDGLYLEVIETDGSLYTMERMDEELEAIRGLLKEGGEV